MSARRLPELDTVQKLEVRARTVENQEAILSQYDTSEVLNLGHDVLIDALKMRPNMVDVATAPQSFTNAIETLVTKVHSPGLAFKIVGEAVLIARHLTNNEAFNV